jgi:hypothetical protein
MSNMYPEGVITLQYADDTLLFLKHSVEDACHLKWLLLYFEKISGMKINYHNTDLTPMNLEEEEIHDYARIFCCKIGSFPFLNIWGCLYILRSLEEKICIPW